MCLALIDACRLWRPHGPISSSSSKCHHCLGVKSQIAEGTRVGVTDDAAGWGLAFIANTYCDGDSGLLATSNAQIAPSRNLMSLWVLKVRGVMLYVYI